MVKRGLAHGQGDGTTSDHMLGKILKGDLYLWAIIDGEEVLAGVVLSVRVKDTGLKVWVEMLAGKDRDLWADELVELLSDFQKLIGARCVEASCRPGIARLMKQMGWREKAVVMELV